MKIMTEKKFNEVVWAKVDEEMRRRIDREEVFKLRDELNELRYRLDRIEGKNIPVNSAEPQFVKCCR